MRPLGSFLGALEVLGNILGGFKKFLKGLEDDDVANFTTHGNRVFKRALER